MAEKTAGLVKRGIKIGTSIQIYHNTSGTNFSGTTELWTATGNGFITATPVLNSGYGIFHIGASQLQYYNASSYQFRTEVSGYIKKGEKFTVEVLNGTGPRKDISAYFTLIG